MKKLFVSIPISSLWCWWRERKARKLAEENAAHRRFVEARQRFLEARRRHDRGLV